VTEEKPYRLVPSELPKAKSRRGVYEEIIEDFLAQGGGTMLVVYGERSQPTIYMGLYTALKKMGRTDVKAYRRDEKVYLTTEV